MVNIEVINIVAANDGPVVALCKSGKVMLWAWESLQGFDTVPQPLNHGGLKFDKIAVGKNHALALTRSGQVNQIMMHCHGKSFASYNF